MVGGGVCCGRQGLVFIFCVWFSIFYFRFFCSRFSLPWLLSSPWSLAPLPPLPLPLLAFHLSYSADNSIDNPGCIALSSSLVHLSLLEELDLGCKLVGFNLLFFRISVLLCFCCIGALSLYIHVAFFLRCRIQHGWGEVCRGREGLVFIFSFWFSIFGFWFLFLSLFIAMLAVITVIAGTAAATTFSHFTLSISHSSKVTLLVTPVALRYQHL